VVVQFGKKKIYTAVVVNIHQIPPKNYYTKYILSILDEKPVMNDIQYSLWKWISDYYMCETGEVMNVAFPSALKLASESKIVMNPSFDGDTETLNEKEYLITEALDIQKQLTLTEVENIVEQKKVIPIIKGLIEKNVVLIEEELKEKYKPKIEKYIRLSEKYNDEKELQLLFDKLEKRAFKQLEVLMAHISLSGFGKAEKKDVKNSALTHAVNSSASAILALTKKGVFECFKKQTSRLIDYTATQEPDDIIFSDYQKIAIDEIHNSFEENDVALFHGVTSSGITEVYI
jgi:primosomal protein N' (replication factor Y)